MNTDYGNYAKELAKAREDFQSTTKKLKESYDKNIRDLEENHDRSLDQTKKVNEERRDKLIEINQDQLNSISNKTNQTLERKQKEYLDSLRTERDQFDFDKKLMKENFQNSLGNIKDSYQKSFEQLKSTHERQEKEANQNFINAIQTNRYNTDKKIQELQKNTDDTIKQANQDATVQKRDLTKKFQKSLDEQNEANHQMMDEKTEYHNRKFADVVKSKDSEIKSLTDRYDYTTTKIKNDDKELFESIKDRYEDHTRDLLKQFQNKYNRLEDESSQKLAKQKTEHDKEVYLVEREKDLYVDRNIKGEGADAQKAIMKDHYERRLDNLKKSMTDQTVKYQRDAIELDKNIQNELRSRELDNRKVFDKREDEFHNELTSLERKTRENDDEMSNTFRTKLTNLEEDSNKKINFEKDIGKQKLENQRNDFAKTITKLSDINNKNIETLQNDSKLEKRDILERTKRELSQNISDVRDDFRRKHEKTVESYDKRLDVANSTVEKIKTESEEKIETIQRNAENRMKNEMQFGHEARMADRKEMQDQVQEMKRDYDLKFKALKRDFDLEMSRVKKENDVLLQRITKKSEEEKNQLIADNAKTTKKVSNDMRDEMMRITKNAKIEHDNLVDHYERRIQELKMNYDLDKLKISDEKKGTKA